MLIYAEGICFEKKEKTINKEDKNQNFFLSFKNASIKKLIDINEKITPWWSIKGVPTDGYASMDILMAYKLEKK